MQLHATHGLGCRLLQTAWDAVANAVASKGLGCNSFTSVPAGGQGDLRRPPGSFKKMGKQGIMLHALLAHHPDRCQTGWQLSSTLSEESLRRQGTGKEIALDVFLRDVVIAQRGAAELSHAEAIWFLRVDHRVLGGREYDPYLLPLLQHAGPGRALTRRVVRRFFTASMDSGVVGAPPASNCSGRSGFSWLLLWLCSRWGQKLRRG